MGTKSGDPAEGDVPGPASLFGVDVAGERDGTDWDAVSEVPWGSLLQCLVALDAGVMLRSALRGKGIAVGVFVGGRKEWQTCVTSHELVALLRDLAEGLEGRVGALPAPSPVKVRKRAAKS